MTQDSKPADPVSERLEPISPRSTAEKDPAANEERDREVAAITRTIKPHSDAPDRAGIIGGGSGADEQGL